MTKTHKPKQNRGDMKVIGGSTIAAILEKSPHNSPHGVWTQLTGEKNLDVDDEAMARGRAMEPLIADYYALRHPEYQVVEHEPVFHPDYPYIMGSPDRMLIGTESGKLEAGLEIKTASSITQDDWGMEHTDEVPDHYWCQCQWYAGLLGMSEWKLAVAFVFPGTREIVAHREYSLEFDEANFAKMIRVAVNFWQNHIEPGLACVSKSCKTCQNPCFPEVTQADPQTVKYLKWKHPSHTPGLWAEHNADLDELAIQMLKAKQQSNQAEEHFENLKIRFIAALGDAEGYMSPVGKVTYKQAKPTLKTNWEAAARESGVTDEIINKHTQELPGSRRLNLPR